MKIFVTGGAGFIGRHLTDLLLKKGHIVTIFDNFSNSSEEDVSKLEKRGAKIVKGDITNYHSILKSVCGSDFVIHLAAKIDVEESLTSPEETHEVNVTGTINLLRACVESGVTNIIAASTAAVYGNLQSMPITEDSPTTPISPYGASKLAMEHYLQAFSNCYKLNCLSLRFFNIYGDGQSSAYAGVITKFMEKIEEEKPLKIFGDGTNIRDFVSVSDVVASIELGMKKIHGKKGNFYNIASGIPITIEDLAVLMISISGKNLDIEYASPRAGDIKYSRASITLAKQELGYSSNIKLKEGLKSLLDAHRKKIQISA